MPSYARPRKYTRKARPRAAGVRKRTYKKRTLFRPQRLLRIGFPKTTIVKLRYVDGVPINAPIGLLGSYVFGANNCFDPNVTGVGHQPMNFDQWGLLYNHYTVVGSKITVQVHDNNIAAAHGVMVGVNLQDDVTFTADATTMMEQGLSRYKIVNTNATMNKGNGPIVTQNFSCKKFFNLVNPMDNTSRIGAQIGAGPTEQAYFVVFLGTPPGSTTDLVSYILTIKIDYIVIFSEPKEQPQS